MAFRIRPDKVTNRDCPWVFKGNDIVWGCTHRENQDNDLPMGVCSYGACPVRENRWPKVVQVADVLKMTISIQHPPIPDKVMAHCLRDTDPMVFLDDVRRTVRDWLFINCYYDKYVIDYNFPIGSWDCDPSPYGKCVYDHHRDPMHDHCCYCGNPQERK